MHRNEENLFWKFENLSRNGPNYNNNATNKKNKKKMLVKKIKLYEMSHDLELDIFLTILILDEEKLFWQLRDFF